MQPVISFDIENDGFVVKMKVLTTPNDSADLFKHSELPLCSPIKRRGILALIERLCVNVANETPGMDPDQALGYLRKQVFTLAGRNCLANKANGSPQIDQEQDSSGGHDSPVASEGTEG